MQWWRWVGEGRGRSCWWKGPQQLAAAGRERNPPAPTSNVQCCKCTQPCFKQGTAQPFKVLYNAVHYKTVILISEIHCIAVQCNAPQAYSFYCSASKKQSFVAQFSMRFLLHLVTNCLPTKQPNKALRNIPRKTPVFAPCMTFCQSKHIWGLIRSFHLHSYKVFQSVPFKKFTKNEIFQQFIYTFLDNLCSASNKIKSRYDHSDLIHVPLYQSKSCFCRTYQTKIGDNFGIFSYEFSLKVNSTCNIPEYQGTRQWIKTFNWFWDIE